MEQSYTDILQRFRALRDTYNQLSEAERSGHNGKYMITQMQELDAELKKIESGIPRRSNTSI